MKLLLDENLSYRIVSLLQDAYPDTTQVKLIGLERADDRTIWAFAKTNGYTIVTKDDDFQDLLGLNGHPPKVIQLLIGNTTNEAVARALLNNVAAIMNTLEDPDIGLIEIY
jgi:predicted nuclease of predicted toxin-antitoxin system